MVPGARSKCYRWLAYDDLQNQGELWPYVEDRADWDRRLQDCYAAFRERALATGVDETTFEDCFDPESAVWTPVQLREAFGTVEWRSPDTTLPSRTVQVADTLAEIAGDLSGREVRIGGETGRVGDEEIVLPEFDTVADYVDTAIHEGLTGSLSRYLSRMGFEPEAFDPISETVDHDGPIDRETARRLRLEYADRLQDDIRQSHAMTAD